MTFVGQLLALKSGPPMRRLRWAGPLLLPHEQDELSFVAVWQAIWGRLGAVLRPGLHLCQTDVLQHPGLPRAPTCCARSCSPPGWARPVASRTTGGLMAHLAKTIQAS